MAIWDSELETCEEILALPASVAPQEVIVRVREILTQFKWPFMETQDGFQAKTAMGLDRISGEDISIQILPRRIYVSSAGQTSNTMFGNITTRNQQNVDAIIRALESVIRGEGRLDTGRLIANLRTQQTMCDMGIITQKELIQEKGHLLSRVQLQNLDCDPMEFLTSIAVLVSDRIITSEDLATIKAKILR